MPAPSTHTVDSLLTLHEPNTYEFRVIFDSTSYAGGGSAPLDVRITVTLGWDAYERSIDLFQLFHCPPDVRGDGPEGGLIEGKRVRVEARLDDALAREHFADADAAGVAARLAELSETDTQHALLDVESWFAIAVTQAIDLPEDAPAGASLREGYRTTWADAAKVAR
jgi:hypothetical protein